MKLKNVLIALLMIIGSTLMAQEKYEQAVAKQIGNGLFISIEGQPYKKLKIEKGEMVDYEDVSPLLKEVANMRNDGWEVWNSTSVTDGGLSKVTYFLRRKLK